MKKCIPILLVVLLLFCGCGAKTAQDTQPTGHASGIQQPQVMYQGIVYYYQATGFDEKVPDTFSLVGTVKEIDNDAPPEKNWCGSLVTVGANIYADKSNPDCIYVEDSQGISIFFPRG